MTAEYHVYLLENTAGQFYVGHTDNLERRLAEHNAAGPSMGKYTRKHGPWHLLWSETHPTRSAAMVREQQIKSWKSARTIREQLLGLVQR